MPGLSEDAAPPVVTLAGNLADALERSGFWPRVRGRILILPDLGFFSAAAPTFTDPRLVEELIDLLHARGHSAVTVGASPNEWIHWTENRAVPVLADLAGYRYVTAGGVPYDFVDLSEETVGDLFPAHSSLRDRALSRLWLEADCRINFAKNKTDEANAYALGLQNLLSLLPPPRLPAEECAADLLRYAPPHFTLIDGLTSNHGAHGSRAAAPLETNTIVASSSLLLADWAAALKMGLDPYSSPLNAHALREIGLPASYRIDGSLATYPGWRNVPPLVLDSARRRNQSAAFSRLAQPWLQQVDPELFPFRELLHERAHAWAQKYLGATGDNAALVASVLANYLIGQAHAGSEALRIVFAKQALARRQTGLSFDPHDYSLADYEAAAPYMEQWERLVAETEPHESGLRWRYLDGSVVFRMARVLPFPFEQWRARVDIAGAVSSMNDYLGGACVPVQRDALGLVTHQAERNIYLPQPNWMAFFGGAAIDVCKLEHVRYAPDFQRIYWRTIRSPNESAEFDDGIVSFARAGEDQTEISIVGRQKFRLPLFWQAVNMDLWPSIKDVLVTHAYENYFRGTLANFQAQYEGREFRIGHTPPNEAPPTGLEALLELFGLQPADVEKYAHVIRGGKAAPAADPAATIDEHGFRHFPGADHGALPPDPFASAFHESRSFLGGLLQAMRKDLGLAEEK